VRILYLAGIDLTLPQGHAAHVRRLCQALEGRGHVVRLIARAARAESARAADEWPGPSGGTIYPRCVGVPRLRHFTAELATGRALPAECAAFTPDVLAVREEALTFAPLLVRRGRLPPLVVECNGPVPEIAAGNGVSRPRVFLLRQTARWLLRSADVVAAVSERVANFETEAYRLDPRRVHIVPNGAWIPSPPGEAGMALRRSCGVRDDEFLLAFAGSMNRYQGIELLLHALAGLTRGRDADPERDGAGGPERNATGDLRLWIIGDSTERPALQRLARDLGLSGVVEFLGGMSEQEAVRHLQAAQAVVAPFLREAHEAVCGEGLKVLQGLATDRPLLVTRDRNLAFLQTNEAVHWVEESDPASWQRALSRIAAAWTAAGRPLRDWPWMEGESPGRRYILEHRTWDHTAAAWEKALEAALVVRISPTASVPASA
jgi:glycosyltransferase involved in cell wall biosynthesis